MNPESFHTIGKAGEGFLKEKGSRFLGFAHQVKSEAEVAEQLQHYREAYNDARHWCYAYRLGYQGQKYRWSDDGEPSHSAGEPILRQIDGRDLCDTLVIVIRYFGGVKLGVGGLIQAYGEAAKLAIDNSRIVTQDISKTLQIYFAYAQMNDVMRVLKRYELNMAEHEFHTTCQLMTQLPLSKETEVMGALESIPFIRLDLSE